MVSIFYFVPNSEALGARSLTSKLTIGHDSQSLEVVEELEAPRVSVVDLLLPLLLAPIQEVVAVFSCSTCIKIMSFGKFPLKNPFSEKSAHYSQRNSRIMCMSLSRRHSVEIYYGPFDRKWVFGVISGNLHVYAPNYIILSWQKMLVEITLSLPSYIS